MSWSKDDVFAYLGERPRLGRLATTDGGGEPHVAPVWFAVEPDQIVVHTMPHAKKAQNIAATGRFALTVDDDEWPYRGVIIRGRARLAESTTYDVKTWLERVAVAYLGDVEGKQMAEEMNALPGHAMLLLEPTTWTGMDYSPQSTNKDLPSNTVCGSDKNGSLPDVEVLENYTEMRRRAGESDLHRRVQAAAFGLLLNEARPATLEGVAAQAQLPPDEVRRLLDDFDTVGRVRRDEQDRVVGIAGLSIEPTQHTIVIDETTRWTWCALDAVGILGALGRGGHYITRAPGADDELRVDFTATGLAATQTVVFVADGYGDAPVVETWCPTVNLFPDATAAEAWAAASGATGRAVPVAELADEATAMWTPITGAL